MPQIWIMDGHNMIFAIPPLQRLQVSDRREEARAGLTERLERFAGARGDRVLVVFDGNELASNPEAARGALFETVYTRRGEGVADDRIIREAAACLKRGLSVTVVTDDRRTLARELPRGVRHLGVAEFWLRYIDRERVSGGGKRIEGDFSDVERDMLARAAITGSGADPGAPARPPGNARGDAGGAPDREARSGPAGEASMRGRIRLKREKGRLRQERRLERRTIRSRRR